MVRTRWMVSAMLGALILVALEAGAAKTPDKRPPAESASTARAQSRNLLVNPGFEDGMKGSSWMPAGWDTSRANLPTVLFTRDQFNVHGGKYAVSVASASGLYYMAHNWSQTVLVGPESWNKDAVFSVWTRSSGVEGRAYVVLQAYRDTISKMAKVWGMDRLDAGQKLGINAIDDPLVDLGWKRAFFPEPETDWVRREVRVFVPPSVSVLFVRCGVIGTGQLVIDDASLTLEPAQPAPEIAPHANLLVDPGFEGDGGAWEYSLPPYPTMKAERDTTIAHSGKASLNLTCGGDVGIIQAQSGVCQVVCNRNLGGKHIKLSGFMKTDTLQGSAYVKVYCHSLKGVDQMGSVAPLSGTTPWSPMTAEMDLPADTYEVWVWFAFNGPAVGRVQVDDASLEVVGPAQGATPGTGKSGP